MLSKRWEMQRLSVPVEYYITITENGLKLGTTLLAKYDAEGVLELETGRITSLLSVAFGYRFSNEIVQKIQGAERALKRYGPAMMHMH